VEANLELASRGGTHEVAAAFCYGREDVIPEMFARVAEALVEAGGDCPRIVHYLERHVELDGDTHGPVARQLVATLCADDPIRLAEATAAARRALERRIDLWDEISAEITTAAAENPARSTAARI
jgi:hypothetical protein